MNLEEASEVLEKVILSMEDCVHSIPPPEIDTDANNNSMDDWGQACS